jgi:protein-L-isoaspartate(D-aspartate) O-methyltransferase
MSQVEVRQRSGVNTDLPPADVIYVCAGAAAPDRAWLDALRPGGRLLFPLAPEGVTGGMLLIKRAEHATLWPAKFVGRARFIGCVGLQDEDAGHQLAKAFASNWEQVRSIRFDDAIDKTCWYAGNGWWLSTSR